MFLGENDNGKGLIVCCSGLFVKLLRKGCFEDYYSFVGKDVNSLEIDIPNRAPHGSKNEFMRSSTVSFCPGIKYCRFVLFSDNYERVINQQIGFELCD